MLLFALLFRNEAISYEARGSVKEKA
jgi:hypothetical protein